MRLANREMCLLIRKISTIVQFSCDRSITCCINNELHHGDYRRVMSDATACIVSIFSLFFFFIIGLGSSLYQFKSLTPMELLLLQTRIISYNYNCEYITAAICVILKRHIVSVTVIIVVDYVGNPCILRGKSKRY